MIYFDRPTQEALVRKFYNHLAVGGFLMLGPIRVRWIAGLLALGGIGAARGFERDIFLADQGLVLRGDLRTPLALGELALFLDAAYGKDRNELTPRWAHVANLGLSWDVMFGRHLQSSFSWAVPITAKASDGLDDDGAQFFWSLRYAH